MTITATEPLSGIKSAAVTVYEAGAPSQLVVTPASAGVQYGGAPIHLNVTAEDANGRTAIFPEEDLGEDGGEESVNWTSSNPQIAKVDQNGNVTAVASSGSVTITAAVDGLRGDVRLSWIETGKDGTATIDDIALDADGRPTTPRMEQAFDTMGVMRRELIQARKSRSGGG